MFYFNNYLWFLAVILREPLALFRVLQFFVEQALALCDLDELFLVEHALVLQFLTVLDFDAFAEVLQFLAEQSRAFKPESTSLSMLLPGQHFLFVCFDICFYSPFFMSILIVCQNLSNYALIT